ncbi:MAG: hypothetical protein IKF16_04665 [Lachnospiraceae bacterium]|nr:hypothetical protein [Lachnospiraceae bacterium]
MKKRTAAILAFALCIALAGCSDSPKQEGTLSESEQQAIGESLASEIDQMVGDITAAVETSEGSEKDSEEGAEEAAAESETPDADYETEAEEAEEAIAESAAPDADYETESEEGDAVASESAEAETESINNPPVGADIAVPVPLMYTGEDPYMQTVFDWMEKEPASYYEDGAYFIPAPVIFYTDDSDPADIRLFGDFQVFKYDLEGENLLCKSGGSHPGLLHLKKSEEAGTGYEAVSFEAVEDGSDMDESMKEIFGKAPAEAGDLTAQFSAAHDDGTYENVRKEFIKMYADQVPFTIKSYQDYGWDPVMIDE